MTRPQNAPRRSKSGELQPRSERAHFQQRQQQEDFTDPSASLLPHYYDPNLGQPCYDEQGHLYYLPANYPGYYYGGGMPEPDSLFSGEQLDWTAGGEYPYQTGYAGLGGLQHYPQPVSEMNTSGASHSTSDLLGGGRGKEQWPVDIVPPSHHLLGGGGGRGGGGGGGGGVFDLDEVCEPAPPPFPPPGRAHMEGGEEGRKRRRLIILRGLPGSGKTTLAKYVVMYNEHCCIASKLHFTCTLYMLPGYFLWIY